MRRYPSMIACDTTGVPRFETTCDCPTYPDNGGSCGACEVGSNGRCVYCDHAEACHEISDLRHKRSIGTGHCDRNRTHTGNLFRLGRLMICSDCFDALRNPL